MPIGADRGVKTTSATSGIGGFFSGCPIHIYTDFRGGAKKQPVPWHGGTGYNGALEYAKGYDRIIQEILRRSGILRF